MIPLTVPEVRRVLLASTGPEEERGLRMGWSLWRRAHQAVARRCHAARRAARRQEEPVPPRLVAAGLAAEVAPTPTVVLLTDAEWEAVRRLLPPQRPPTGRPRRDHRTVLAGVLWVLGTGSSWRDLPKEEFGPWQTVYDRYSRWREEGLWQRIIDALSETSDHAVADPTTEVSL